MKCNRGKGVDVVDWMCFFSFELNYYYFFFYSRDLKNFHFIPFFLLLLCSFLIEQISLDLSSCSTNYRITNKKFSIFSSFRDTLRGICILLNPVVYPFFSLITFSCAWQTCQAHLHFYILHIHIIMNTNTLYICATRTGLSRISGLSCQRREMFSNTNACTAASLYPYAMKFQNFYSNAYSLKTNRAPHGHKKTPFFVQFQPE